LAFEGNARIAYSEGNYDYYLEKRARAAAVPMLTSRVTETSKAILNSKPRKLNFKEQKELEGMEAAIHEWEQKVAELEALFLEPDFHRKHGHRILEIQTELKAAKERVAASYVRWEKLEAIRANEQSKLG